MPGIFSSLQWVLILFVTHQLDLVFALHRLGSRLEVAPEIVIGAGLRLGRLGDQPQSLGCSLFGS